MAGDFENGGLRTFISGIETSARRLMSNMESIYEKYNKPFADDDLIKVSDLSICRDKGSVRNLRRTHHFGTSKLQSTRRKDEILRSQVGLSKCAIDPNVSRAIARQCVSYLNDSTTEEGEPSDAETLSSSSGDEDDGEVEEGESGNDEEDGEGDESPENSGTDEMDFHEDNVKSSDIVDLEDSCDEDDRLSPSKKTTLGMPTGRSKETAAVRRSPRKGKGGGQNNEAVGASVNHEAIANEIVRHRQVEPRSIPIKKAAVLSNSPHAGIDQTSPSNTSVTSSLRNLSFVSIQSPKRNSLISKETKQPVTELTSKSTLNSLPSNVENLHEQTFVIRDQDNESYFNRNSKNQTKTMQDKQSKNFAGSVLRKSRLSLKANNDVLPKGKPELQSSSHMITHIWRSPEHVKMLNSTHILLGNDSVQGKNQVQGRATQKEDDTNQLQDKMTVRQQNAENSFIFVKSPVNETLSTTQSSHGRQKTFVLHSSPVKSKSVSTDGKNDSVFKSPQGIKVRRVCPIAVKDGKQNSSPSPKQTSPSVKQSGNQSASTSLLQSPKLPQNKQNDQIPSRKQVWDDFPHDDSINSSVFHNSSKSTSSPSCLGASKHLTRSAASLSVKLHTETSRAQDEMPVIPTIFKHPSSHSKDKNNVTQPSKNKHATNDSTLKSILSDVSFSSSDDESEDDAEKSYNFILQSPRILSNFHVFSDPSYLGESSNNIKKQSAAQTSGGLGNGAAISSVADVSLTTSLRNLELCTHNRVSTEKSPCCHHDNVSSSFPKEKQAFNFPSLCHSNISTTLHKRQAEVRNKWSQSAKGPQSLQCQECHGTIDLDEQRTSLSSFGFDQSKWTSVHLANMETRSQIISPTHGRLKRKASGSYTSGYFTDTSASLQNAHNGFSSCDEQTGTVNTTLIVPDGASRSAIHQNQNFSSVGPKSQFCCCPGQCQFHSQKSGNMSAFHQNLFCSDTRYQSSSDLLERHTYGTNSAVPDSRNMHRPFAVAKKRLKLVYNPESQIESQCPSLHGGQWCNCGVNTACQQHQQDSHSQLFTQKDPRVCEWVNASSKVTDLEPAVHYASCPPKVPLEFHLHQQGYSFGQEQQKLMNPSNNFGTLVNKRDIGIQASLNSTADHTFTHLGRDKYLDLGHGQPSQKSISQVQTRKKADRPKQNAIPTSSKSIHAADSLGPRPSCKKTHLESYRKDEFELSDTLSRRALSVWRDIQTDNSYLGCKTNDDSCLTVDHEESSSLVGSVQLPASGPLKEVNQTEETVLDSHSSDSNNQHSSLVSPQISTFLRSGLNKAIQGNFHSKSFVETHSPRPKVKLPNDSVTIASGRPVTQASNHIMFPPSYIDKFSPCNPHRVDSDATTFASEQKTCASLPSVRESLKTFRPRRNQPKKSPSGHHASKKDTTFLYHQGTNNNAGNYRQRILDLPLKRAKSSDSSYFSSTFAQEQNLPPADFVAPGTYSFVVSDQDEQRFPDIEQRNISPSSLGSDIPKSTDSNNGFSSNLYHCRASTPARQLSTTPDLSIDETISTIIPPASSDKFSDTESSNSGTLLQNVDSFKLESDDSSDDVDLL